MINLAVLRSISLVVKWKRLRLTLAFPSAPPHAIEHGREVLGMSVFRRWYIEQRKEMNIVERKRIQLRGEKRR